MYYIKYEENTGALRFLRKNKILYQHIFLYKLYTDSEIATDILMNIRHLRGTPKLEYDFDSAGIGVVVVY
jgi:hypothetical protein